jgi:hypothetical protein
MSACWQILKKDKEMLVFPIVSALCCLLVMATFAVPFYLTGKWQPPTGDSSTSQQVVYYGILFLFYFCNYLVVIFFNCGIVACATIRMGGGDPTVRDGLRAALSRFPSIVGWAFLSATVGLLLRIIEDRSEKIGRIVSGILGIGWTLISYLVVPILAMEGLGPVAALKESTRLLKKTWGEQLIGGFSFGLIFFLLALPGIGLIILGFFLGSVALLITCISVAVIYLVTLGLIQAALQSIFQAALYLYARNGQVPEGFQAEFLQGAMAPR